jgi:hypothetical protein
MYLDQNQVANFHSKLALSEEELKEQDEGKEVDASWLVVDSDSAAVAVAFSRKLV